ncbi:MAG: histone H1/H5 family protein [Thaumarchaeota archaeon]|nr:histone H1/H5 family protein [Nitrososphaerota archaeon]
MDSNNEEINKQRLLELQQFVLNRKTDDIRTELYEHMVTSTIFEHGDNENTLSYDDLKNHLQTEYNITKIPDLHLKNAINNLTGSGILSTINQKLNISQVKRNEIKKNLKESLELENQIRKDIFEALHKKIPTISTQQCDLILEKLSILLGTTFARYGNVSVRILTEGMNRITELKKQDGFQEIYQKAI